MFIKKSILLLFFAFNTILSFGQIDIFSDHISLDSLINSSADEVNVVIHPDGRYLYFTRKNHQDNIGGMRDTGDIWVSEKNDENEWKPARNLRTVNSKENNLIIGFTDNGSVMVTHSEGKFALSYLNNNQWSKPAPFDIPYFHSASAILSGSISTDGRYFLFGMESFGSYGVEDIYVSRKKPDGSWTSPKNLGAEINTSNQEVSPFLAADNKTLFFASNGHQGEGSFDIFTSSRLDDTWQNWSTAKNLGPKVNTAGRERSFTFLTDAEFAYLSSTQNSDGYGDLKKIKIQPNIKPEQVLADTMMMVDLVAQQKIISVGGNVYDKRTKEKIVGAEVLVTTEPTNIVFNTLTNSNGDFRVNVDEGTSYVVKVSAFRYLSVEEVITEARLLSSDTLSYALEPIIEGRTVTLEHVLFEQGKATLVEGSQKELDLVIEMMKYNPEVSIFLAGHTDNQGKASLNIKLSEDRVQTVNQYLVSQGVSKKRISGKGYGGTKPIASNANAETRKLNRRVEFTVHRIKNKKSTDQ